MLARSQKPHAARLLFLGGVIALLGLGLSVTIVLLKYPRHREICSSWAGPRRFEPNINNSGGSPGSITKANLFTPDDLQGSLSEGIINSHVLNLLKPKALDSQSINIKNNDQDSKENEGKFHLRRRRLEMSEAAQKYYSWMKEVNSKIPFIPILPFNVTNAYDEADIELWIASHRCLRPMPDNTNTNDPLSQRVIRRIMRDAGLMIYCCTETKLELFFPPTISESIRDWSVPEGRIFYGFMIIASFLVLLSAHSYTLSNVCSANDSVFGFINTAWLRNYFPPIGLMLVACVPTVPVDAMYSLSPTFDEVIVNLIMFSVHMCGAIGSFFGYAMAELWALNILPDRWDPLMAEIQDTSDIVFQKQLHHGNQRFFRSFAVIIILGGCSFFSIGFTVVMFAGAQKYIKLNETSLLFFRWITYFSEAAAAAGLGISLLIIWYYCPERFVPLKIERDFFVLEQFVEYLEGVEGMQGSLADMLKLEPGPFRTKIEELEKETHRELEMIRKKRNQLIQQINQDPPMGLVRSIDEKYDEASNIKTSEFDPFLGRYRNHDLSRFEIISFTDGFVFKRRFLNNVFHKPPEQVELQSLFKDSFITE